MESHVMRQCLKFSYHHFVYAFPFEGNGNMESHVMGSVTEVPLCICLPV